jgi:hypothetical protein
MDGAVAFTKYFAEQANRAYETVAPEPIKALSTSTCKTCEAMVSSLTKWRDAHYRYEGKFVVPTSVTISSFLDDGNAKTLLVGSTPDARVVDSSGSVVQTFPGASASSSVFLVYREGQWKVTEIQRAA